jgi:hypothetical protein
MIKHRMKKRRRAVLSSDEEIDPMIYAVNMIDCMLVLAVGFLIFTIIFMNTSPQQAAQSAVDIKISQPLNETPQNASTNSENGLTEMGTVYKDPNTGKLIMVQKT